MEEIYCKKSKINQSLTQGKIFINDKPTEMQYKNTGGGFTSASFVFLWGGGGGEEGGGHRIRKLIHPKTKAGPSINKNRPILRQFTTEHELKLTKLKQVLFNLEENHPFPGKIIEMVTSSEILCVKIMTLPQGFGQENSPILAAHP